MDQRAGNRLGGLVSDKFESWYEPLLPESPPDKWEQHPHFDLRGSRHQIARNEPLDATAQSVERQETAIIASSEAMGNDLKDLTTIPLISYLEEMPLMTASDVMQNPNKLCRLMTIDGNQWYGAIEIGQPQKYLHAWQRLSALSHDFNRQLNPAYKIGPIADWAQISQAGRDFFITPFLGPTLEQEWRSGMLMESDKRVILQELRTYVNFSEKQGVFWRDFAPRNMFFSQGKLHFIDFEHLYATETIQPLDRAMMDRYRRIWFADMLDGAEIDHLFSGIPKIMVDERQEIAADTLEKVYFKKDSITIGEQMSFLELTAKFERMHMHKTQQILGHRLGLYMSDFAGWEYEAKIYTTMRNLPKDSLVRYFALLEQSADKDQQSMLAEFYGKGRATELLKAYVTFVEQNADDPTVLNKAEVQLNG